MTPYEKYCSDMRSRGLEPTLSEPELHEAWGIKKEEHVPVVSRTHAKKKNIVPTLANHTKPTKKPVKKNVIDKPKKIKRESTRVKQTPEERREKKLIKEKERYRKLVKSTCGREVQSRNYVCLDGFTDEQRKQRRLQQKRDYRKRKREATRRENGVERL